MVPGQASSMQRWCCLVFAEQKVTCLALARLLQACEVGLGGLKTDFLMGFSGSMSALSLNSAVRFFLALSEPRTMCHSFSRILRRFLRRGFLLAT